MATSRWSEVPGYDLLWLLGLSISGAVIGGSGTDTLRLNLNGTNLSTLDISNVETVDGAAGRVRAIARKLAAFAGIETLADGGGQVRFFLAATGQAVTLDLAVAFEPNNARELHITGSPDRDTPAYRTKIVSVRASAVRDGG